MATTDPKERIVIHIYNRKCRPMKLNRLPMPLWRLNQPSPLGCAKTVRSCHPSSDDSRSLTDDLPGKQWHAQKKAFRPTAGLSTFEKRSKDRALMAQMKAKEKEMKDEKEAERQVFTASSKCRGTRQLTIHSAGLIASGKRGLRRRRRSGMKRWPRKCTANVWRDSSGRRRETSSSAHERRYRYGQFEDMFSDLRPLGAFRSRLRTTLPPRTSLYWTLPCKGKLWLLLGRHAAAFWFGHALVLFFYLQARSVCFISRTAGLFCVTLPTILRK